MKTIADLKDFTWKDYKHICDPRVYRKGSLVHPIASQQFVQKNLQSNNIESIYSRDSTLRTGLPFENPQQFLPLLEQQIIRQNNPASLLKFWNYALEQRWIPKPYSANIALGKPAIQSSICSASCYQDVNQDASLLVDGNLESSSRSHTDFEATAWVMIDLVQIYEIRSILIYVRPDSHQNFCNYSLHFSLNHQDWGLAYKK